MVNRATRGTAILVLSAGVASAYSPRITVPTIDGGFIESDPIRIGGEVYVGTSGEVVLIPSDAVRAPGDLLPRNIYPLWLTSNFNNPCGDLIPGSSGDRINPFFAVDRGIDTDGDGVPEAASVNNQVRDAGDIHLFSLVTGFRVFIGSEEPTPDTDGDGAPEFMAGATCTLRIYTNENLDRADGDAVEIATFELPFYGDPTPDDGVLIAFFYTWDLERDFGEPNVCGEGEDASFRFGSFDYRPPDLDDDGLIDFGYSFEFSHVDRDEDGDLDVWNTYLLLAPPWGDVVDCAEPGGPPCNDVVNVTAPHGTGAQQQIDVYDTDPSGVSSAVYRETLTGRFVCTGVTRAPYYQLALDLLHPGGTKCPADLNCDGIFNATDLNLFVTGFIGQCALVDINGDGQWNTTDINLFITLFLSQCA